MAELEIHNNVDFDNEEDEDNEGDLRKSLWAISPQAKARAYSSNRKSDMKKQIACVYNMIYIITEKEYSLSTSLENLPAFKFKDLLSDKSLPEVLRARYLNLLIDDMDFSKFLMDLLPEHYEEVRTTVNMDPSLFKVKNIMLNNLERYEKFCSVFQVPFWKEGMPLPGASRRGSRARMSFTSFSISAHNLLEQNQNKTEQDYDNAVVSVHNHQQYENQIVSAILARYQDLQTKMLRLRVTQINLILDRPDVRHALENIEEDRYVNIVQRLISGKEKEYSGKSFKSTGVVSKIVEGIQNPEEYFAEERMKAFNKLREILIIPNH